jgi:DNA repair protein SbcC/Rad50
MLVEPGRASAQHIVDLALVPGEFRDSINKDEPVGTHRGGPSARRRLKRATLSGFRAYGKPESFDLDANVIVLYGPNGLGKTSFFDAIDFACTGRIGRLCRRRITQGEFERVARNLARGEKEAVVELELADEGHSYRLRRHVGDWGRAAIDEDYSDRPGVIEFLSGARWDGPRPRVEHLEKLFRATHLFDQSTPELLVDFHQESNLSIDIVTRLLALDDYSAAGAKCGEVVELLKKAERAETALIAALKEKRSEIDAKLQSIPLDANGAEAGNNIKRLAQALVDDLRHQGGVAVPTTGWSLADVSDWRAMAEGLLGESRERLQKVRALSKRLPEYERAVVERDVLAESVADAETSVTKAAEKLRLLREKAVALAMADADTTEELNRLTDQLRATREFGRLQRDLVGTERRRRATESTLLDEQQRLSAAQERREALTDARRAIREEKSDAQEARQQSEARLTALTAVRNGVEQWQDARDQIGRFSEDTDVLRGALAEAETELTRVNKEESEIRERLAALHQQYSAASGGQAELATLLDRLEAFIEDDRCPACGAVHGDEGAILRAIRSMKVEGNKRAEPLASNIRELEKRNRDVAMQKATLEERVRSATSRIAQLTERAEELTTIADAFEHRLKNFSLPKNPGDLAVALETAIDTETKRSAEAERAWSEADGAELRFRIEWDQFVSSMSQLENLVARLSEELAELGAKEGALKEAVLNRERSLERAPGDEKQTTDSIEAQIAELSENAKVIERELNEARREAKSEEQQRRLSEAAARDLRSQSDQRDRQIVEIEAFAREIGVEGTPTEESIAERVTASERRTRVLDDLIRRALALEGGIDAASRDARRAELTRSLGDNADALANASEKASGYSRALKRFSTMDKALRESQEDAVATHVDSFGPLTTLLQKRLRPVFGFGDISLKPRKGTIEVLVERDGSYVRPTDYFSDSQRQILALSIFLSARMTQTWSGFAPILLDDPVTHFDDLNAFAFVEAIRGIAGSEQNTRQFIISTCEERLFNLMQEKLTGVAGGAKFYRFDGIAKNGPIVSAIPG